MGYGVRIVLGRGPQATLDMKRRIAGLDAERRDVIEVLWCRMVEAERGDGFHYEYAREY